MFKGTNFAKILFIRTIEHFLYISVVSSELMFIGTLISPNRPLFFRTVEQFYFQITFHPILICSIWNYNFTKIIHFIYRTVEIFFYLIVSSELMFKGTNFAWIIHFFLRPVKLFFFIIHSIRTILQGIKFTRIVYL